MMKITMTYMDGKELEVKLVNDDVSAFFACLDKHQFFFDSKTKRGFWTDIEKIRHITVAQTQEYVEELEPKKDEPCEPPAVEEEPPQIVEEAGERA